MTMRRHIQALSKRGQGDRDEEEDNAWKYEGDIEDGKVRLFVNVLTCFSTME